MEGNPLTDLIRSQDYHVLPNCVEHYTIIIVIPTKVSNSSAYTTIIYPDQCVVYLLLAAVETPQEI